jgi:hypothetical protein
LHQFVRQVAAEIDRYCAAHPQARDTIEGIMWWVQIQRTEELRDHVALAVSWLVSQGRLEQHELHDGSVVFGSRRQPEDGPA